MAEAGCLQKLTGLFLMTIGIIIFIVLLADLIPFTEFIGLLPFLIGVKMAFPNVKLPKIGK